MARPDGIRVEIHWSIARPDGPFQIDLDGLWERAQRASIVGVEALVLSPEDLILHLCLHSSFTHKFRIGLRMCWDIREVVRHYRDAIDWDLLVRRAQQWGIGQYVYLTLRLVRELLAADIPVARIAALEPPGLLAGCRDVGEDVHLLARERRVGVALDGRGCGRPAGSGRSSGVLRDILYPSRTALARIYGAPPDSSPDLSLLPATLGGHPPAVRAPRVGLVARRPPRPRRASRDSERIALEDWLRRYRGGEPGRQDQARGRARSDRGYLRSGLT